MIVDVIDVGEDVVCDGCGGDYSNSEKQGGLLFGESAYCPECAPGIKEGAAEYGEAEYIRGECPVGLSFREWVLQVRGGNNQIILETVD